MVGVRDIAQNPVASYQDSLNHAGTAQNRSTEAWLAHFNSENPIYTTIYAWEIPWTALLL